MVSAKRLRLIPALVCCCILAGQMAAQSTFSEAEPNGTKATASGPFCLNPGNTVAGTISNTSDVDDFEIDALSAPQSVYRYTLTLAIDFSASAPLEVSIRGLQTMPVCMVVPNSDVQVHAGFAFVAWYGFGQSETVVVALRALGTATTTAPYVATLSTSAVTPTSLGAFLAGPITVSQAGLSPFDTEIIVYDSNLDPIPGFANDNPLSGGTQAVLTRTFTPGTYFMAIARHELCNQLADPPDSTGGAVVLDFAGSLVLGNSSFSSLQNFTVTDRAKTVASNANTTALFEVRWFTFTVDPNLALNFSQSGGPFSPLTVASSGGRPGHVYVNAISLNAGAFPQGWFFGVDIPFPDLAFEVLSGPPFSGLLNAGGGATTTVFAPIPPGLTLYAVTVEFHPFNLLPTTVCPAPKVYVTL